MMGSFNFVFTVSIFICELWGTRADIPCAAKSYASAESVVCVCNATYCDNLVREVPCDGKYVEYTSSASGLRLMKTYGRLNTYSPTASAKYSKILYLTPSVKYQKIVGFGGAVTDSAAINWLNVSKPVQQALIKSYYGRNGIGYSLARVPIGGTDFSKYFYTYSKDEYTEDPKLVNFRLTKWDYDYKIPMLKAIQKATVTPLKVQSTIWAPPEWMIIKSDYNACGKLKKKFYQALADYHRKFIEGYASYGIPIWAISGPNEPSMAYLQIIEKGNCMKLSPEHMGNWIAKNLGPTIRNMTQKVLILGNEDMRLYLPVWIKELAKKVPEAMKYIDGISVHFYEDDIAPPSLLDDINSIYPDKFLIYTESCIIGVKEKQPQIGSWSSAEHYMKDIIELLGHAGHDFKCAIVWGTAPHLHSKLEPSENPHLNKFSLLRPTCVRSLFRDFQNMNHHVVGWIDWNLCLNPSGGPTWTSNFVEAPILVFGKGDYFIKQPMFYAMAHVAKFAVRGSYRIKVIEENNYENSVEQFAVLTPNNTVAVVLHNPAKSSASVGIVLGGSVVSLKLLPKSFTTVELPNETSGCQLQTRVTTLPGTPVDVELNEDSVSITYNPC